MAVSTPSASSAEDARTTVFAAFRRRGPVSGDDVAPFVVPPVMIRAARAFVVVPRVVPPHDDLVSSRLPLSHFSIFSRLLHQSTQT